MLRRFVAGWAERAVPVPAHASTPSTRASLFALCSVAPDLVVPLSDVGLIPRVLRALTAEHRLGASVVQFAWRGRCRRRLAAEREERDAKRGVKGTVSGGDTRGELVERLRKCNCLDQWDKLRAAVAHARVPRYRVWVVGARGLPNADARGKSDPYVEERALLLLPPLVCPRPAAAATTTTTTTTIPLTHPAPPSGTAPSAATWTAPAGARSSSTARGSWTTASTRAGASRSSCPTPATQRRGQRWPSPCSTTTTATQTTSWAASRCPT